MIRRIAYVMRSFPRLSQTFVIREIDWLLSGGFDVQIFCLRRSDEIVQQPLARSPRIRERLHVVDSNSDSFFARFAPEIIHAHFATDATRIALEFGQRHRVPVTFTAHGYDIHVDPPADLSQRAFRAAFVITVSEANRRSLVETLGVDAKKIKVVPNGVDTQWFAPDPMRLRPEWPHAVCVARLEPVKQLHVLLDACAFLRAEGVAFRCTVVGEGSCRGSLEMLRESLGLHDYVAFVGAADSDSVRQYLRSAHLAVLSSQSEGYPVSLLEAASTGVPAVAPAVGGIPEIIVDGSTGFITRPADPISLGTAMKRLCVDHRLASEMGHAARRRALQWFSIDRQMGSLLEVWEEVMRRCV